MTQRLYFVGNADPDSFRIAKMDRTLQQRTLIEDQVKYSKAEMEELLAMIDNGNRATGGLKLVVQCFGIFGFVKILEGFYVILITKRSPVALLGGHYIYHIDDTNMINIAGTRTATTPEQARYLQIFEQVDITKNFYFSYTYDITRSLQYNMTSRSPESHFDPNPIFVWNDHLTKCVIMENNSCWKIPIIHGFVDQSKISVLGHRVLMTLVARRSRCFAGARLISCLSRFLKRGVNSSGMVANDVETEQIVNDECTTLFPPVDRINSLPGYTSFLQNRGSIPLFWSQESNTMVAKPPIDLDLMDPFFTATALHFDHLFERYGSSIIVLNLIKAKERVKREGKLMAPFKEAVTYLNQSLPDSKKIKYIAWDMARASKSHDQDVIHHLEEIAENVLKTTGFFHAGSLTHKIPGLSDGNLKFRLQNGVLRTNCIDCLDRTNAAQFVVGKCALGYQVTNFLIQLYALGIIAKPALPFDCVAVNLLNAMYHDHGDTIALQYGGSHLVNTMETYRKISSRWTSHSRDMIEIIKRYYSNSFTDAEKQAAMNLFLGLYDPSVASQPLWDLPTDFFLHNGNPDSPKNKRDYFNWFTPKNLVHFSKRPIRAVDLTQGVMDSYYKPQLLTTFENLFVHNLMYSSSCGESSDSTPFELIVNAEKTTRYLMIYSLNIGGVKRWMALSPPEQDAEEKPQSKVEIVNDEGHIQQGPTENLIEPAVSSLEYEEYQRYIDQFNPELMYMESSLSFGSLDDPDMAIFQEFLNTSSDEHGEAFKVKDEDFYARYLHSGTVDASLGMGSLSNLLVIEEGYRQWSTKGFLPPSLTGRHKVLPQALH